MEQNNLQQKKTNIENSFSSREKSSRWSFILHVTDILNLACITGAFAFTWYDFYSQSVYLEPFYRRGNWIIVMLFAFVYFAYGRTYDAFAISTSRVSEIMYSQGLAIFIADFILYLVMWILLRSAPDIIPLLICLGVQMVLAVLWSLLTHAWYFHVFGGKRTAVIYDKNASGNKLIYEYGLEKTFDVQRIVGIEKCLENQFADLKNMECVFLIDIHSHERNQILKYCVAHNILAFVRPRIGDAIMSGARHVHILHLPILRVGRYSPAIEYAFCKRVFDIISSAMVLLITSPFFIAVSIAIKMTDHGPIFYKQCRLTKDGRKFDILKFRSMCVDAEKDGIARLSTGEKDDRITSVGKFIRKTRLDELPQLINIIKGDMSVVGPRPERPEISAQYEKTLPEFILRLQSKAGLTGLAQVYGKYNTTPYDKLEMDLLYLSNPNFLKDLEIIFATIKILFIKESTEGVSEGQMTANRDSYNVNRLATASVMEEERERHTIP